MSRVLLRLNHNTTIKMLNTFSNVLIVAQYAISR